MLVEDVEPDVHQDELEAHNAAMMARIKEAIEENKKRVPQEKVDLIVVEMDCCDSSGDESSTAAPDLFSQISIRDPRSC